MSGESYVPKTMIGREEEPIDDAAYILCRLRTPDMALVRAVAEAIGQPAATVDLCWTRMVDAAQIELLEALRADGDVWAVAAATEIERLQTWVDAANDLAVKQAARVRELDISTAPWLREIAMLKARAAELETERDSLRAYLAGIDEVLKSTAAISDKMIGEGTAKIAQLETANADLRERLSTTALKVVHGQLREQTQAERIAYLEDELRWPREPGPLAVGPWPPKK